VTNGVTAQDAQEIYWNQFVLLKVVGCYVRHYRDEQAWWVNRIGLFKAIVTSSTIGAWLSGEIMPSYGASYWGSHKSLMRRRSTCLRRFSGGTRASSWA